MKLKTHVNNAGERILWFGILSRCEAFKKNMTCFAKMLDLESAIRETATDAPTFDEDMDIDDQATLTTRCSSDSASETSEAANDIWPPKIGQYIYMVCLLVSGAESCGLRKRNQYLIIRRKKANIRCIDRC